MPMTQTPAAGWFVDPQDATSSATGTARPGPSTARRAGRRRPTSSTRPAATWPTGCRAGSRRWAPGSTRTPRSHRRPGVPTFASVAASCRDEPARQPLSVNAHLVLAPTDLAGVAAVFAQARHRRDRRGRDAGQRALPAGAEPVEPGGPQRRGRLRRDDDGGPAARRPRGGVLPAAWRSSPARDCSRPRVADLWAQGRAGVVTAARVTVAAARGRPRSASSPADPLLERAAALRRRARARSPRRSAR